MPILYLVRHGKAEVGAIDDTRHLTDRGRKAVGKVARTLRNAGVEVERIEHSGLVRARETAEILVESVGGTMAEVQGLRPGDNVHAAARRIEAASARSLMLVGHNPFMEDLAALLLTGDAASATLHFRTGAVACFSRAEPSWALEWFLAPALL